jgi:predicted ATPase
LHNLPVPLSSLVGRTRELERVGETLRRTRLVTLTGPGGVGKTRLAPALAERQVGRRSAGVRLVDLAQRPEETDVAREVARVLAVAAPRGTTAIQALQRYLLDRDPLLVLDNCEHVVDAGLGALVLGHSPVANGGASGPWSHPIAGGRRTVKLHRAG